MSEPTPLTTEEVAEAADTVRGFLKAFEAEMSRKVAEPEYDGPAFVALDRLIVTIHQRDERLKNLHTSYEAAVQGHAVEERAIQSRLSEVEKERDANAAVRDKYLAKLVRQGAQLKTLREALEIVLPYAMRGGIPLGVEERVRQALSTTQPEAVPEQNIWPAPWESASTQPEEG